MKNIFHSHVSHMCYFIRLFVCPDIFVRKNDPLPSNKLMVVQFVQSCLNIKVAVIVEKYSYILLTNL